MDNNPVESLLRSLLYVVEVRQVRLKRALLGKGPTAGKWRRKSGETLRMHKVGRNYSPLSLLPPTNPVHNFMWIFALFIFTHSPNRAPILEAAKRTFRCTMNRTHISLGIFRF